MNGSAASTGWTTPVRALVMAGAMIVLCWPLSVTAGVVGAALGGFAGVFLGQRLGASRLRTSSGFVLGLLGLAVLLLTASLLVSWSGFAGMLGPIRAFGVSEWVRWLGLAGVTAGLLRLAAVRRPMLGVLEPVLVALAVTGSVMAHRGGMVHRPLAIGDWAWARGIDPGLVLLGLGWLASVVLTLLLFQRPRRATTVTSAARIAPRDAGAADPPRPGRARRTAIQIAALALIALALLFLVRTVGPPAPKTTGDLGLTGDPAEASEEEGGDPQSGDQGGSDSRRDDQMGDIPFRDEYQSGGNEAPVAVVVLHDDYEPPSGVFYFRQSAFSQFNGRRLVQATRGGVDEDIVPRFPTELLAIAGAPEVGAERMALPTSVGLLAEHVRPFALDSPAELRPLRNPNPARFRRAFGARSHVQTVPYDRLLGRRPGDRRWSEEQWDHYTEAPSDRRYRELAARLVRDLKPDYRDDPLAKALVIKEYLDENGIYSRRSKHASNDDPAASFLFGDLTGYCVHFAHAATYLLRALDVPARVAAGYAVPAGDRGDGSALMIRGMNAHAWPEIRLDGLGWVVVDLAPQQSLDEAEPSPDQALQRMLGEMMRELPAEPDLEDGLLRKITLALIAKVLLLLALACALLAYTVKLYRQLVPLLVRSGPHRLSYRAALDRLSEVGLRRSFGETRERFAHRAQRLSPSFEELSRWHLASAFGSRRVTDVESFRRLLARTRAEIDRGAPRWRRVLGALDPFSWLRAR